MVAGSVQKSRFWKICRRFTKVCMIIDAHKPVGQLTGKCFLECSKSHRVRRYANLKPPFVYMFADQTDRSIDLNNYVATESSFWKLRCGNRFLNKTTSCKNTWDTVTIFWLNWPAYWWYRSRAQPGALAQRDPLTSPYQIFYRYINIMLTNLEEQLWMEGREGWVLFSTDVWLAAIWSKKAVGISSKCLNIFLNYELLLKSQYKKWYLLNSLIQKVILNCALKLSNSKRYKSRIHLLRGP